MERRDGWPTAQIPSRSRGPKLKQVQGGMFRVVFPLILGKSGIRRAS